MNRETVRVFAPASISNIGPGFDAFGCALESLGDTVSVRPRRRPGVEILDIQGDDGALPREVEANTASVAAAHLWSSVPKLSQMTGLAIVLEKGLPLCSGLGSSAASAVGGAVATAHLIEQFIGHAPDDADVIEAALVGEAVASGGRHLDNVAPSLFGGFTIVRRLDPPDIVPVRGPEDWWVVVVTPDLHVSTSAARAALPKDVPLFDAVANWANAAAVALAFERRDLDLLARSMEDRVVEAHRAKLVPGYAEVRAAALETGARVSALSGSGPTIFAITENDEACATRVADAMAAAFREAAGLESRRSVSRIACEGARRT